jgi:hypothetical protein
MENDENQTKTQATNPPGENGNPSSDAASQRTLAIAGTAFNTSPAEPVAPKKRGRPPIHGKYCGEKRPKKGLPMGQMDNGSAPIFVDETQNQTGLVDFEPEPEPYNREVETPHVNGIIRLFRKGLSISNKRDVLKKTGDKDFALLIADNTQIPEDVKELLFEGLHGTGEQFGISYRKFPIGSLLGGIALAIAENRSTVRQAVEEYLQKRPVSA